MRKYDSRLITFSLEAPLAIGFINGLYLLPTWTSTQSISAISGVKYSLEQQTLYGQGSLCGWHMVLYISQSLSVMMSALQVLKLPSAENLQI